MPPPQGHGLGDARQPNPLRWGRARDRRRNWQLRAFAAWRWALRYRWHLAWYAAWDQPDLAEEPEVSPTWARFVSRTLEVDRLVTRVAWCLARIGRELSRPHPHMSCSCDRRLNSNTDVGQPPRRTPPQMKGRGLL